MKKIGLILILVILMTTLLSSVLAQTPAYYCGDGLCSSGETENNCPIDCRCVVETLPEETVVEEREVQIPFFDRGKSVNLEETCGYDGNLDGILCDPNEDWVNCPSDCSLPSVDSLLCLGKDCIWQEAWFARILIVALVGMGGYLIYRMRRRGGK